MRTHLIMKTQKTNEGITAVVGTLRLQILLSFPSEIDANLHKLTHTLFIKRMCGSYGKGIF